MMAARRPTSELSHGGRFYRAHRERELQRKHDEKARWESSLKAFLEVNSDLSMSEKQFRAEAKRQGWLAPNHSPKHRPSKRVDVSQRRFVEEALGREYSTEAWDTRYGV
jgi:hypothetical protein